jgi:hypothetical protein
MVIVIDTPEGIEYTRLATFAQALAFEINTGIKMTRGSVLASAQRSGYTSKRTKKGALRDIIALQRELLPSYEESPSILRALQK